MPLDTTSLGDDFVPMNHKTKQPIGAIVQPVYTEEGKQIPGFNHIIRGDTGDTIRIAPDSYTIVQNEYAIEAIEGALAMSRLDLTDARFGIDYSHDGARMFAQWILPRHTATVREGVEATLRVVLLNSYDGTSALSCRTGAFNWVCANASVSGKEFASFRFQHSGQIDLLPAVAKLARAAEDHADQVKRWQAWPKIPVTDQQVRAVLTSLPRSSEAQQDALIHAWLRARDEDAVQGGANLWCLYNCLTAWASHDGSGGENKAARDWERQTRVASLMETKAWQALETVEPLSVAA